MQSSLMCWMGQQASGAAVVLKRQFDPKDFPACLALKNKLQPWFLFFVTFPWYTEEQLKTHQMFLLVNVFEEIIFPVLMLIHNLCDSLGHAGNQPLDQILNDGDPFCLLIPWTCLLAPAAFRKLTTDRH
ncbi:hypothetical protein ILYODFUR_017064 [Ilyodon furcidens]|uniref:Uncharacterized protein n=1 Tax=Ilyodon furcidens TaxID=33524 RepID=A0ABV0V5D2_9TELE